jgi:large subunit ribosomal protein L30
MYAAIRLRGKPGTRQKIIDTLEMLNLKNKFNCALVPENESYDGMLKKVKNFVTWGEVDEDTLVKLILKRGSKESGEEIDEDEAEEMAGELMDGEKMQDVDLKPNLRLTPPSKGFRGSTKKLRPKGEAGYRGDEINKLLERMM